MEAPDLFVGTYRQILRDQMPNLFRLYLNPYVAQTCLCLERYVHSTWFAGAPRPEPFQSFLANSFDEALSGAIKLARYNARPAGKPTVGVIIDPTDRLGPFATGMARGTKVEFVSGLVVVRTLVEAPPLQAFDFVVWTAADQVNAPEARRLGLAQSALHIVCADRSGLDQVRAQQSHAERRQSPPAIVVFDESFVNRDVPFGAFTARRSLFDPWNSPGNSTFHSTTFQPNTISALHFMRCLEQADPKFHEEIAGELHRIGTDLVVCKDRFRRWYSPALARAISMTGFDTPDVRAAGNFVLVNDRQVLDGVGGVACSVRGHNPPGYADELEALVDTNCEADLAERLRGLTGLNGVLPAVSGASAVENALRIALVAQFPRRHVLALKAGFAGKTLLALTGTWNASYKQNIAPLYHDVSYVDPFAPDAIAQINEVFEKTPPAVVQLELIQGVGGVRRVPEEVVMHLDACRARHGYLLLVDEVQTGMYRTGPFTQSSAIGLVPDLLIVGKAVCDMMFPFAVTLYSDKVRQMLQDAGSTLARDIRQRYGYTVGYQTAVNVLRFAEKIQLGDQVAASGKLVADLLGEELAACKAVRAVRVFGLLIGIELDVSSWPRRWFKKRLHQLYLAAMLRHPRFPVLVGFCQSEPNVLKVTPPLTLGPETARQMCATIGETLRRPLYRLVASAVATLINPFRLWGKKHERTRSPRAPSS